MRTPTIRAVRRTLESGRTTGGEVECLEVSAGTEAPVRTGFSASLIGCLTCCYTRTLNALPSSGAALPEGAVVSSRVQHGTGRTPVSRATVLLRRWQVLWESPVASASPVVVRR